MNTHTFDNHSVTCPICQRTGNLKQIKMCNGLFTCPYCQERLVVSWSGNYVRDPHNSKQVTLTHLLRRQSKPWARALRDVGFVKRPSVIIAIGSAVLLGVSLFSLKSIDPENKPTTGMTEQVTESINTP